MAIPGLRIPHLFLPIWMNPLVIDWRLSLLGFWPARVFYACGDAVRGDNGIPDRDQRCADEDVHRLDEVVLLH